jgi:KRAB domain-containing zinc finger protein
MSFQARKALGPHRKSDSKATGLQSDVEVKEESSSYDEDSFFIKDEPEVSIEEDESEQIGLNYSETDETQLLTDSLQCQKCFRTFPSRSVFNIHKCLNDVYPCNMCSEEFSWQKELTDHRRTHIVDNFVGKKFKCDKCPFAANYKYNLKKHIEKKHEERTFLSCDACNRKFSSAKNHAEHIKHFHKKHDKQLPPCHYCKETLPDEKTLQEHIESHECTKTKDGSLKCIDCDRTFDTIHHVRLHRSTGHGIKSKHFRHTCDKCGTSFRYPVSLKRHLREYHATDEDINAVECNCSGCKIKFETAVILELHQRTCLIEPKNYSCKKCSLQWSSTESIRKHYAEAHRTIGEICVLCGLCLKENSISNHMKSTHLKQKESSCELCGKVFSLRSTLKKHILLVHEKQNGGYLKCEYCDYIEISQSKMDKHRNMKHTKSISFDCPYCSYQGFSKQRTKQHIRLVHKVKPM